MLTFRLVVNDGELDSLPAIVNVSVKHVNKPPVAHAGPPQTVKEGSLVTLDGTASYDPDVDPITFRWSQQAGPLVPLSDSRAAQPTFTAPTVGVAGATLTFGLVVSDGTASSSDSVTITVEHVNHPPVANAGVPVTVDEGRPVTLDGSLSSDPDGDPLTYLWTQVSGPVVQLSGADTATPGFVAPPVGPGGADLVFRLIVDDGVVQSAPSEVTVHVKAINDPPVCTAARASTTTLWPPDHRLVQIQIGGVTDPDRDPLGITIIRVLQDEPVNGLGDGDASPDAVIQGGSVLLRAERSGTGNGRVYNVYFQATDGHGNSCSGDVPVTVPHSPKDPAVDDGPRVDSTRR